MYPKIPAKGKDILIFPKALLGLSEQGFRV